MAIDELNPHEIEATAERAIGYLSGTAISALVLLGDQLGLYRALREAGPVTSTELATRAGLNERWVREWLHGQASAGLVQYTGDGHFELTRFTVRDFGNPLNSFYEVRP